ncbi:MAG TPA: NAD(P)/FAD-dependent oxidoreductase [Streptosporangiaceae bacterium]|jgi:2-polyprenyl-6-methoxyphenol hydroxylase-like FAD-dependent oxidoreductase|nr:NAD(P)/FAD-dependent oxidoreductase [Streptosporangiaceae bacterium]
MTDYDAIVVGARCAGSVLATRLGRAGWRVLLVDRATFPSDTVSTHFLFPNTLQRLAALGVMERLHAGHDIPRLQWSWRVLGRTIAGAFTPIAGEDRLTCIRRVTLDAALVEEAAAAGVTCRFGERVTGLAGAGRPEDPVRGVVLAGGDALRAPWVFGADGRNSTIARALGLAGTRLLTGDLAFLFGYWTGLPATEWFRMDVRSDLSLVCCPCEDGVHLVVLAGRPPLVRGDRLGTYLAGIRRFPATLNPRLIDRATMISPLVVAPEPMLRGFFRPAHGPGWALVGDACHFKHPVTAQGISDAVEQAWFVADALLGDDQALDTYQNWRDARAAEHYEWSFQSARLPHPEHGQPVFAGLAADPHAGQEWRDLFTRLRRPSEVFTAERLSRWAAAWQDRPRIGESTAHG